MPGVQHPHFAAHSRDQNAQRKRKSTLVRAADSSEDKLELGLVRLVSLLSCVTAGFDLLHQPKGTSTAAHSGHSVSQAPAKPRSPVGQMVTYYLKMEPHLFKDALDEQFRRLKDEKDEADQRKREKQELQDKEKNDKTKKDGGELVLFQ